MGSGACRQRQLLTKARAPQPADGKGKGLEGGGQSVSSPRIGGNRWQAFAKNSPWTRWMITKNTPHSEAKNKLALEDRDIRDRADIAAMDAGTHTAAARTCEQWRNHLSG